MGALDFSCQEPQKRIRRFSEHHTGRTLYMAFYTFSVKPDDPDDVGQKDLPTNSTTEYDDSNVESPQPIRS
jgi:hypothetical protein